MICGRLLFSFPSASSLRLSCLLFSFPSASSLRLSCLLLLLLSGRHADVPLLISIAPICSCACIQDCRVAFCLSANPYIQTKCFLESNLRLIHCFFLMVHVYTIMSHKTTTPKHKGKNKREGRFRKLSSLYYPLLKNAGYRRSVVRLRP